MNNYTAVKTGPRRKSREETKRDVMALLMGDEAPALEKQPTTRLSLDITDLVPFANHPFKLYEGARLGDMARSIKEHGVIVPIVVRPVDEDEFTFEILSGHNRVNAAKTAGLTEVPAVIMRDLTDEDAALIVTETNLLQRSFADLSHSQRAIALKHHLNAIKAQGKRTDLINEIKKLSNPDEYKGNETSYQVDTKMRSNEKAGAQYGLSSASVARYVRLSHLTKSMLDRVDTGEIPFIPAVALSHLSPDEQGELNRLLDGSAYKVDMKKAESLREFSAGGKLTPDNMAQILSGELNRKIRPKNAPALKITAKIYRKYFDGAASQSEMAAVVDQALAEYFENHKDGEI
ncbi:MAG: ParB N-terminal domain-containing protein [Clostridiales Family XIII bacterium]|jgi:ParB family chromosome partitioning protein|nr:ParB N-terminal domain-containing protein [Clostridiales Family XIII bacterium]